MTIEQQVFNPILARPVGVWQTETPSLGGHRSGILDRHRSVAGGVGMYGLELARLAERLVERQHRG